MIELSEVEKLIIKQAFVSAVGADVKTKDPNNLRGWLDATMEEQYYSNPLAGTSYDLKLLGQKVGTYTLTVSKGKPSKVETGIDVVDESEFVAWAEKRGYTKTVVDMDAIENAFRATGEVPDGCLPTQTVTPEVLGGKVTRSTIRVDSAEVARVLGPQLEPVVYALLEGGEIGEER